MYSKGEQADQPAWLRERTDNLIMWLILCTLLTLYCTSWTLLCTGEQVDHPARGGRGWEIWSCDSYKVLFNPLLYSMNSVMYRWASWSSFMRRERTGMPCLTFRAQFRQRLGIKKCKSSMMGTWKNNDTEKKWGRYYPHRVWGKLNEMQILNLFSFSVLGGGQKLDLNFLKPTLSLFLE